MFRVIEERTEGGAKFYRLSFGKEYVDIREDWKFAGVKLQLERFIKACEEDAKIVERDYGTKHVHQANPNPTSEVLVWYDVLDGQGRIVMQTFDRYPNCTFEVNRNGVCRIYDADKKLIASVRGWKKVCYA